MRRDKGAAGFGSCWRLGPMGGRMSNREHILCKKQ